MAVKRAKWMERRESQGYSYGEVVAEINRRVAGEYFFSAEHAGRVRKSALQQVGIMFRLSALLSDFLKKEGLTLDELFAVYHDDEPTHRDFLKQCFDPFLQGDDIACDDWIDVYYPGYSIERDA